LQAESDDSDEGEPLEEEAGADDMQLFADDKFDPEFRVTTWQQTILGELYGQAIDLQLFKF